MARYLYNSQKAPPAPFVYVLLANPTHTKQLEQVPAQVDTGADRTVIPWQLAVQLELVPIRVKPVEGLCGEVSNLTTFLAQLAVHEPPFRALEVFGATGESYILLGRDVLNAYRVLLDGPGLAVELELPKVQPGSG